MPTGKCLRKFDNAHSQGVTSVAFSKDNTQILSASFDNLIRHGIEESAFNPFLELTLVSFLHSIHGMRTRSLLKELRGHTSFVNAALFTSDQTQVISASSDGTVRLWDVRSGDCLHTFRGLGSSDTGAPGGVVDLSLTSLWPLPKRPGHFIVCSRSKTIQLINIKGEVRGEWRRCGVRFCSLLSHHETPGLSRW